MLERKKTRCSKKKIENFVNEMQKRLGPPPGPFFFRFFEKRGQLRRKAEFWKKLARKKKIGKFHKKPKKGAKKEKTI
jgi:hypothetical protein